MKHPAAAHCGACGAPALQGHKTWFAMVVPGMLDCSSGDGQMGCPEQVVQDEATVSGQLQGLVLAIEEASAWRACACRVPEEVPPAVNAVIDGCLSTDAGVRPSALDLVRFFSTWGAEGATPPPRSSALLDVAARRSSSSSSIPSSAAPSSSGGAPHSAAHAIPAISEDNSNAIPRRRPVEACSAATERDFISGAGDRPAPLWTGAAGSGAARHEGVALELAAPAARGQANGERPLPTRSPMGCVDTSGTRVTPLHVPAEAADAPAPALGEAGARDELELGMVRACSTGGSSLSPSAGETQPQALAAQQRHRHAPTRPLASPFAAMGA